MKTVDDYVLAKVRWADSCGFSSDWCNFSEENLKALGISTITSVGYIIKETEKMLCLAPHISDENVNCMHVYCGEMCIPKVAIISIEMLRENKPKYEDMQDGLHSHTHHL